MGISLPKEVVEQDRSLVAEGERIWGELGKLRYEWCVAKKEGMTQREYADAVGVSQQAVAKSIKRYIEREGIDNPVVNPTAQRPQEKKSSGRPYSPPRKKRPTPTPGPSRTQISDEERERRQAAVKKLVDEGYSRSAICEALDIGDGTLTSDMQTLHIKADGKRKRTNAPMIKWRDGEVPPRVSRTKAEKIAEDLMDPDVVAEVESVLVDPKKKRRLEKLVRMAEKEVEAARLDREKREAEDEKETLRQAQIARDTTSKSVEYWKRVRESFDAAAGVLAVYFREVDNYPPLQEFEVRMLERSLEQLELQIHQFRKKVHPEAKPQVPEGVIDIDS